MVVPPTWAVDAPSSIIAYLRVRFQHDFYCAVTVSIDFRIDVDMTKAMRELTLANQAVLKEHAHADVVFSSITEGGVQRLLHARGFLEGRASIPAALPRVSGRLAPHKWTQASETREAPLLLSRLKNDVTSESGTSITNYFMDVQHFAGSRPMTLTVDDEAGELKVSGVPDLAILEDGLDDGVIDPFSNACVVVDWQTEDKAGTRRADLQVMAQAIVLANKDCYGTPAFLTDLVKGFRCWIVVDGVLFHFHSDKNSWLSLAEGTALIRYFIANHGRVKEADAKMMLRNRGAGSGGSSSSAGGGAIARGSGGDSNSSDLPEPTFHSGAAGLPSSAQRWQGGGSHRRTCSHGASGFGVDSAMTQGLHSSASSPSSPPSSSPLSSEEVAEYQRASFEEFSAKLDFVRESLD